MIALIDSIISQALEAVLGMCDELGLFEDIGIGPMGAEECLRLALSPGGTTTWHMDRRCVARLSVVLNAKHRDMRYLISAMGNIHDALCRSDIYPQTGNWQITGIVTESMPELIGRDPGDKWTAASALIVTLYY